MKTINDTIVPLIIIKKNPYDDTQYSQYLIDQMNAFNIEYERIKKQDQHIIDKNKQCIIDTIKEYHKKRCRLLA